MEKTTIASRYISQDEIIRLKDVSSLNIANYSDSDIKITLADATETLLAYDNSGFPTFFEIKPDGTVSDVDISIEYVSRGAKVGNAILRYRKLINKENC